MKIKKAIIPCAGLGTRFLPITKVVPKELLPIVDTPALFYILDEAQASGIEEVLIVISPKKQQIKRLFEQDEVLNQLLISKNRQREYELANKHFDMKISFATQQEMTGNGDAIALGKEFVAGEPFAVLFGDDVMYVGDGKPVTKQLMEAYELTGKTVVGCQRTPEDIARKCGVMQIIDYVSDKVANISGIVEKPSGELPSDFVSLGRFVLTSDIFDAIARTGRTDGEVYLTDAIGIVAKEKGACACLFDARRYDIGDKEGYLEAVTDFALRDAQLKSAYHDYLKNID